MAAAILPPHLGFETRDRDQASERLTTAYGTPIRMTGHEGRFSLRYTRLATDILTMDTLTQTGAEIDYTLEPTPVLLITRPLTTTLDHWYAGSHHQFGPGEVFLFARSGDAAPVRVRMRGGGVQATTLPLTTPDQLAAPAETLHPEPIRFTDWHPVTKAAAHQLNATIDYLATGLRDHPETMRQPLVTANAARLLAATVLTTFPNTTLTEPTIEDRHDSHPATLRRAIAFIDDHADTDINVADIAAAANVTIRAVQHAFRRHRDTTPMTYLRQARLEQAHRELLAAHPATGATVTEIAARWGFFHPGRFAHHYRATYGRPPHRTLLRDSD
ncbi:helix-turn-helix transcriptional regulator [Amycolatopsis sp. NPDC058986]|uniref:helix-turn-helix transcriptional regulator n=1 Tax=unclassified Amycolatopsis TaxID=2618356 RepID=UPI00366D49ED